jgi:hypothetical protein
MTRIPNLASILMSVSAAAATSALLYSCGTATPEELDPLADAARNGTLSPEVGVGKGGNKKEIAFTVPPPPKAVDVAFFMDDDGDHHRNGTVKGRFTAALEGFVARTKFTQTDVIYLLGPAAIPGVNGNGEPIASASMDKTVGFWKTDTEPEKFNARYAKFRELFAKRFFDARDDSYAYAPLSGPRRTVGLAVDAGVLRGGKGAFTHIVLVASRPDVGDLATPAEVIATFDEKLKGGWFLTVVGHPEGGCNVGDDNGTLIGQAKKQDGTTSGREYKHLALAKAAGSKGRFVSLCERSFDGFMQGIAANPSSSSGVEVALGAKAVARSINVTSPKGLVTGWTYKPGETKLTLPGFLDPGLKLTIRFVVHDGKSPNPVATAMAAPPLVEKQLSPDELEFLDKADGILQRTCGDCHRPGGRTAYPGNFALFRNSAEQIKERINKPAGDAQRMPPNGLSAGDLAALNAYIDALDN